MAGQGSANVQSLEALQDLRVGLIGFAERVELALGDLRSRIDRTLAWLEQDRPLYWREQERRAYDAVASARVAYETCRLRTVGGRHSECIEERQALQRAKARLDYCQAQFETVRRWNVEARRQVDDYRGRSGPLQRRVEDDVPLLVATLARLIQSLEEYADVARRDPGADRELLRTDSAAADLEVEPLPEHSVFEDEGEIDGQRKPD